MELHEEPLTQKEIKNKVLRLVKKMRAAEWQGDLITYEETKKELEKLTLDAPYYGN